MQMMHKSSFRVQDVLVPISKLTHCKLRFGQPDFLQGPVEVVKKGSIRNIQLTMEDRQGGRKHVTRVIHVESFGFDADDLAGILQRKFQTSSSVTKLPGKSETGKEIALQGPLLHEIPKFLTATYGRSSSFIDVKAKGK